jgi:MFS family permease
METELQDQNKEQRLNTSHREIGLKSDKDLIHPSKIVILNNNDNNDNTTYEEMPERWYNLVSLCFCLFANGFQWLFFSTISQHFSYHNEISLWKVNMFSTIYFIIYPFLCIPEGWLIEKYNIKLTFKIAAGTTLFGSFLKIFTNFDKSLSVSYIGQIITGSFRPLLLNSPGKFAANWFREENRILICSICYLCDICGILVGYLFSLLYFPENMNKEVFRDKMFKYTISEFLLCYIFCIPAFFVGKEKPDKPCSLSQYKYNLRSINFIESLKDLFSNCQFILLLIPTFFIVGYYYIMGVSFNNLMLIYGVTKTQCTIVYTVSIVIGIIASLIISYFLNKYMKFKLFMIILCILALVFQVFLTFLLEIVKSNKTNVYVICFIFNVLINAVVIPLYTTLMNYACEITYAIPESLSGGIMMTMANLCGIFGTYLFDHFINNYNTKPWISNVIIVVFFCISFVFIIFFNEKLLRYDIDKEGRITKKINLKDDNNKKENEYENEVVDVKIKQN